MSQNSIKWSKKKIKHPSVPDRWGSKLFYSTQLNFPVSVVKSRPYQTNSGRLTREDHRGKHQMEGKNLKNWSFTIFLLAKSLDRGSKKLKPFIPREKCEPTGHLARWYRDDLISLAPHTVGFWVKVTEQWIICRTAWTLQHNEKWLYIFTEHQFRRWYDIPLWKSALFFMVWYYIWNSRFQLGCIVNSLLRDWFIQEVYKDMLLDLPMPTQHTLV